MREYRTFTFKDSNFRICSSKSDLIIEEIKNQREKLEQYINIHPQFLNSLKPIKLLDSAPPIARAMQYGSEMTGVGPMAAVAGTVAQFAAERAIAEGADEAIVENGGDIFLYSTKNITIGLYAGSHTISNSLAFNIDPDRMPCAICSSSSKMGHSLSLGNCDLATVISKSASIADAAATLACNMVNEVSDIDSVLNKIISIRDVDGVLLVKDDKIGLIGDLPQLVKHHDNQFPEKITRDKNSDYS